MTLTPDMQLYHVAKKILEISERTEGSEEMLMAFFDQASISSRHELSFPVGDRNTYKIKEALYQLIATAFLICDNIE